MICLAGPSIELGRARNLSSSGINKIRIVATTEPFKEAIPPTITMVKIRMISISVKLDGSM